MSSYCISDIHGDLESFRRMLKKIGFSPKDTLYLLGDAIDRGDRSLEVLRLVMETPNIVMLMGNHEQMMLDALGPQPVAFARQLWMDNGGAVTHFTFTRLDRKEQMRVLDFLTSLPDQLEVQVNGRDFLLVHGAPAGDRHGRLWNGMPSERGHGFDGTVVFGHTPTWNYLGDMPRKHDVIWHGNRRIGIDCGCGSERKGARLGCLRLDDLAEFYV